MDGGIPIGRIRGIPVFLHPTWFVVFFLVTVTLSTSLGREHEDWPAVLRLGLAAGTAILFFASIFLHELGHSIIAMRHHVGVRSITLFIFGGVAVMEKEPPTPRAEFEIAIAGPVVSGLLALGFGWVAGLGGSDAPLGSMLGWLAWINFIIAVFNLLPGFPLDGGRVLRAFLWARSGNFQRATRVAANVGQWIAYGFIGLGVLQLLSGNVVGGMWQAFIGWFLLSASGATVRQAEIEHSLAGLVAKDVMSTDVPRVAAGISVGSFARDLVLRGRRWALVVEADRTSGIVTLSDVKRVPPEEWDTTPVGRVATPIESLVTVTPMQPLRDVLSAIGTKNVNQIPVVDDGKVLGAVTRDILVQAIELRGGLR
ncbi:Putative zinc metalloprotease Rip3 [Myxococcaceae bacterium]|jgi:Zn-dependent protease|nr:Putative zinc metalloprotease Rip3 [Myxococcaceae bacterium]